MFDLVWFCVNVCILKYEKRLPTKRRHRFHLYLYLLLTLSSTKMNEAKIVFRPENHLHFVYACMYVCVCVSVFDFFFLQILFSIIIINILYVFHNNWICTIRAVTKFLHSFIVNTKTIDKHYIVSDFGSVRGAIALKSM